MVGVIGVGLFAVYQAQKGIRLPLVNIKSDANTADATDPELGSASDPDTAQERVVGAPPTVVKLFDDEDKPPVNASRRQKSEEFSPSTDTTAERGAKQVSSTKALGKANQTTEILPVKRTRINFKDDAEPPETESSSSFGDEPPRLPSDAPADEATNDKPDETQPSGDPTAEKQADPFSDDTPPATTATEPAAEFDSAPAEPVQESSAVDPSATDKPGKTQISSQFDSDEPPPPRSNRAKRKTEKRTEAPVVEDADAFGDAPDPIPLKAKKSIADDVKVAPLDSLGRPDDQVKPEYNLGESSPVTDSLTPTTEDSSFPPDDGSDPPRGLSRPKDNAPPAQLPAVLPDAGFDDAPTKKREPAPRRGSYDAVTQTDLIGDGDIGDPSQRGVQHPRLTIEKIAQQQAVLGQPLIYSIIVKNIGNVDAHNVVIEDRIPKGTELKGTSPQAELSGKRLIWNHPLLRPNEEKKISIKVVPQQEGPIGSVARVYFATEVSTEIVVAAPQLEFTIKAPREVRIGQRFDMVFLLKNIGKVDATNIVVRDLVPESLKNEAGNDIECPVGKLAPNESREIVLSVTATKTGTVLNQTILTADSGVRKSYENEIDVNGEVLVLTRSGHNQLYVERSAVFTNNIRNDGNQRADRVKIAEVVPAGMQFETASDGGKFDPQTRAVVWTLGPLAPGSDRSVTVKYVPKETGTLASNITATGNLGSTATVNASVKVIGKPELQMETLSATGIVTVGERITSRFQLNNSGTASANNVQLRIRLPGELRLISARGAKYRQDGDDVIFEPIVELAPKSKASFELLLEPIAEADAQIGLEIAADHLSKPGRRIESIQIARDALK